jgi:hypothetical protein
MISLNFHWIWLIVAGIIAAGIAFNIVMVNEDQGSYLPLGGLFGCFGLIISILVSLVLLGIFVW